MLSIFGRVFVKSPTLHSEPPRLNLTSMMKKAVVSLVKKICATLRLRRYALGLSQNDLRVISKTDSCRIENGKTEPKLSRFIILCRGLKISPGWLLVLWEMYELGILSESELMEVIKNWDDYKRVFSTAESIIAKGIVIQQKKGSKAMYR